MWKPIVQIGGAILSAIYNIGSLVADAKEWFPNIQWQYHAILGFVLFVGFMIWIVIDKQHQINVIRGNVRLVPKPKKISSDESGVEFIIDLEIWTDRDIHTDNLVLNIIATRLYLLSAPFWKIWKSWEILFERFLIPAAGLRVEGGPYRKSIKSEDRQPFYDTVTFKLKGDEAIKVLRLSRVFMMELVLITGIPNYKYRQHLEWKFIKPETLEPV